MIENELPRPTQPLFFALIDAAIPIAHHYSDLYFPVTEKSTAILNKYPQGIVKKFENQVEGGLWYDVPFAYLPYWQDKSNANLRKVIEKTVYVVENGAKLLKVEGRDGAARALLEQMEKLKTAAAYL